SIVLFSTIYSTGMADQITTTGIATAFIVYPQAIVQFTNIGWINAIFGIIFYLTLSTLAIDSAFSIAEGVSRALSDKFGIPQKKATISIVLVMAAVSVLFITGAGIGWLDIVDNWANTFNLIIIGIAECIFVGWVFKPKKVLDEVNKNTKKFKMPRWWFETSVKILSPLVLTFFFGWNLVSLFQNGGYGGYPLWAQILGGWLISALVLAMGFIVALLCKKNKKLKAMSEKAEADEKTWDELEAVNDAEEETFAAKVETEPTAEVTGE
ncbi:MAG: hypothetical protein IJX18_01270, partial [Clostridia bacterium]|nr:hypothetical protein [Clostridia bacterium]